MQQQNTATDLIVVGKRPAPMWTDVLFESVAQRILHDARTDVLVVPHGFQLASRGSAVERLVHDLPVRRVKAGALRPPSYPNPAAAPGGA